MSEKTLLDFLPEVTKMLEGQLEKDQERWGDTWKSRPVEASGRWADQTDRAFQRFQDYYDQWYRGGTPVPWLKVIGECVICIVRENHPEELETDEVD